MACSDAPPSVVLDVKCDPCSNECPVFRLRSRSIYRVYLRRASSHQQQRYDLTMGSCPHSVHSDAANNIMNTSDGGNQRNPCHCRTHLCCNHFFANWLEGRLWSHDMISDLLVIDILISSFQQFINWGEGWTPLNNSWKLAAATSCQLEGVLFLEENKLSDIQQTPADVDLCCHKTSHLAPPNIGVIGNWSYSEAPPTKLWCRCGMIF